MTITSVTVNLILEEANARIKGSDGVNAEITLTEKAVKGMALPEMFAAVMTRAEAYIAANQEATKETVIINDNTSSDEN